MWQWLHGDIPGTTLQIRLYQSGPPFSAFPAASDFVEASYAGYIRQTAITFGGIQPMPGGYLYWEAAQMLFSTAPSNDVNNTINGWYAVAQGGAYDGLVAAWGSITPPQDMSTPGESIAVAPSVTALQLTTPVG
jgi:hypothetical protein